MTTICFHETRTKIGETKQGNLIFAQMKCENCGEIGLETVRYAKGKQPKPRKLRKSEKPLSARETAEAYRLLMDDTAE